MNIFYLTLNNDLEFSNSFFFSSDSLCFSSLYSSLNIPMNHPVKPAQLICNFPQLSKFKKPFEHFAWYCFINTFLHC